MTLTGYLAPRPYMFQVSLDDVFAIQECDLPSSCAILQPCLLEGTSVPLVVWCPALSWRSVCPNAASTSSDSHRLSGASVVQQRTVREQIGIVAQEVPWDLWDATEHQLHRTDTRNRQQAVLRFLQRVEALSPLVPRLWLNISQDVLQHELKQLGMMFHVARLFLRSFFYQFMNSSLTCARCRSTLSQRGRMYGLIQASVSSLCRV